MRLLGVFGVLGSVDGRGDPKHHVINMFQQNSLDNILFPVFWGCKYLS